MNNVNCRRDMTEILLKAALNTIQSINQSRNALENGFEEEIIHRRFIVFHQTVGPTSHTCLSTNNRFNLWHGLVYF